MLLPANKSNLEEGATRKSAGGLPVSKTMRWFEDSATSWMAWPSPHLKSCGATWKVSEDKPLIFFLSCLTSLIQTMSAGHFVLWSLQMKIQDSSAQPLLWNVQHIPVNDQARTNNQCESWNNGFQCLVGHCNPSLWTMVKCIEKDASMVEAEIL